jgi:hypothetical protein
MRTLIIALCLLAVTCSAAYEDHAYTGIGAKTSDLTLAKGRALIGKLVALMHTTPERWYPKKMQATGTDFADFCIAGARKIQLKNDTAIKGRFLCYATHQLLAVRLGVSYSGLRRKIVSGAITNEQLLAAKEYVETQVAGWGSPEQLDIPSLTIRWGPSPESILAAMGTGWEYEPEE